MPPGVTTVTVPDENGVIGTNACSVVAVEVPKLAEANVPNLTAETPSRFVPVIVTSVPGPPSAGLIEVIFGSGLNVAAVVSAPAFPVFTVNCPAIASLGTRTFTAVAVGVPTGSTPACPAKSTEVTDPRPWPAIVTVASRPRSPARTTSPSRSRTFVSRSPSRPRSLPTPSLSRTGGRKAVRAARLPRHRSR